MTLNSKYLFMYESQAHWLGIVHPQCKVNRTILHDLIYPLPRLLTRFTYSRNYLYSVLPEQGYNYWNEFHHWELLARAYSRSLRPRNIWSFGWKKNLRSRWLSNLGSIDPVSRQVSLSPMNGDQFVVLHSLEKRSCETVYLSPSLPFSIIEV